MYKHKIWYKFGFTHYRGNTNPMQGFGSPPAPCTPPHAMYKADPGIGVPGPRPLFDFHPVNLMMSLLSYHFLFTHRIMFL